MQPTTKRNFRPRVVKVRKAEGRGMAEGLVWVEAYLPLDVDAFHRFSGLVAKHGSAEAAALADPALAELALTPIDTHGEAMLPEDLMQLAHAFVADSRKIDVMHDQQAREGVAVVQSFVNTPEVGSPNFWPGAWVTVLKIDQESEVWQRVESGELDAVSFMALVTKLPIAANLAAQEGA